MQKRTANVNSIYTTSIVFSSIFNIGDTTLLDQHSKAIAVQKEAAVFTEADKLSFQDYSLFKQKANVPPRKHAVHLNAFHHSKTINVQNVSIIGVSQSSVFQVGSINNISSEARIKHFRKLKARQ